MYIPMYRWDICDAEFLRYKMMHAYDRAMIHLEKARRGDGLMV